MKPLYFGDQIEWCVRTETGDVWVPGEVSYIGSLVPVEHGPFTEEPVDAFTFKLGEHTIVRGKLSDLESAEGLKWRRR